MPAHPVHLEVERTLRPRRIHVVLRLVLLVAAGALSLSVIPYAAYLALPALVALAILHRGVGRYGVEDIPRVLRVIRWLASAGAYLWLLTDVLPTAQPGPVVLHVDVSSTATPKSALLRIVTSIPAVLLVAVLSAIGSIVWAIGALWILAAERLPHVIGDYLALTLRTQLRLLAYHLSLVDVYPRLADHTVEHAPRLTPVR